MRHRTKVATFGRKTGPRRALLRGLVGSLVEHGRIKTTLAKAKELRRHVEPAVTLGKKGTLHARRLLLSRYPNEKVVSIIMGDLAPRFKDREGGYTRIMKLGQRPGDRAEMAFIEFVDFTPNAATAVSEPKAATGAKKKAKKSAATDAAATAAEAKADAQKLVLKRVGALAQAKKKRIRKAKEEARRVTRA